MPLDTTAVVAAASEYLHQFSDSIAVLGPWLAHRDTEYSYDTEEGEEAPLITP